MNIRTILVPIDGSPLSLKAVDVAAGIAQRFGAEVTVLTALEPPEAVRAYMSADAVREVERGLWAAAEQMLDQAAARVSSLQIAARKRLDWNTPATMILQEAPGFDLIVMGSRGLGMSPSDRNLLGSVAERVLRRAPCPVLILPEHPEE